MLLPLHLNMNLQPVILEPRDYFRTIWPRQPGNPGMPELPGFPVYPPDPLPPPRPMIEPMALSLERARRRQAHHNGRDALTLLLLAH